MQCGLKLSVQAICGPGFALYAKFTAPRELFHDIRVPLFSRECYEALMLSVEWRLFIKHRHVTPTAACHTPTTASTSHVHMGEAQPGENLQRPAIRARPLTMQTTGPEMM